MSEDGVKIPLGYIDIPSHKLFACEPPNEIYHYTDFNGASGILESKSLWLTKLSYLNDKTELKLAIDLFRREVTNYLPKVENKEKREFIDKVSHQLQSFSNTNVCVASFCENGDLLSQWRSYGNDGSGISLEFNAHDLKRLANTGLMNLWKCVYTPHEQRMVITGLIDILSRSYDVIALTRTKNKSWEATKSNLIGYFNTTFLRVAPVIKNHHFYEEKEWRIITVSRPYTDENWFSRVSNSRVSQYYRLNFDLIDNGEYKFITGAIVGPNREPKLVSDALWVMFHKNGYKHKHVGPSQIPYRS